MTDTEPSQSVPELQRSPCTTEAAQEAAQESPTESQTEEAIPAEATPITYPGAPMEPEPVPRQQ